MELLITGVRKHTVNTVCYVVAYDVFTLSIESNTCIDKEENSIMASQPLENESTQRIWGLHLGAK